jgi:hypothetical protein
MQRYFGRTDERLSLRQRSSEPTALTLMLRSAVSRCSCVSNDRRRRWRQVLRQGRRLCTPRVFADASRLNSVQTEFDDSRNCIDPLAAAARARLRIASDERRSTACASVRIGDAAA